MVSFSCDACGDVVKKPKLAQHYNRCYAPVTCLDCSKQFAHPKDAHTSCISEDEKYQKALFKGKKQNEPKEAPKAVPHEPAAPETKKRTKSESDTPSKKPKVGDDTKEKKDSKESKLSKKEKTSKKDDANKKEKTSKKEKHSKSARAAEACDPAAIKDLVSKLASTKGVSLSELASQIEKSAGLKRSRIIDALFSLRLALKNDTLVVIE